MLPYGYGVGDDEDVDALVSSSSSYSSSFSSLLTFAFTTGKYCDGGRPHNKSDSISSGVCSVALFGGVLLMLP